MLRNSQPVRRRIAALLATVAIAVTACSNPTGVGSRPPVSQTDEQGDSADSADLGHGGHDGHHDHDHDRGTAGQTGTGRVGHDRGGHDGGGHDEATHAAAIDLVDPAIATDVATTSGRWGDPTTWRGGAIPADGARVHIPADVTVTVGGVFTPEIETIGVDGTLRFTPEVDTELRVDTLVTTPSGTLEIGTPERPIAADVTARVVFADDGPIDRERDPSLLSRGALLHGRTVVQGAEVTHRSVVAAFPRAGDITVELSTTVDGWKVGDEIVITGTNGPTSDEVRTVAAVSGTTITLSEPLTDDHVPPAPDLELYVANLSRNVQFTSENTDIDRRGHVMIMHTLDASIRGARFTDLGRTDKSRPLDDVEFIDMEPGAVGWEGGFERLGGSNVRGRYSVHVHRGGADPSLAPAVIADSVVTGDPGWAFTNHSSHVDFLRNVSYDTAGSGFFTEAGDETGRWVDNIAIRTVMPTFELDDAGAIDPDLRAELQDFGVDGDGFWLQGNRIDLIGNVAAGSSAHGIIWWSEGLAEADLGRVATVEVATLPDPTLVPDRSEIPVWWAPLGEVRDNVAYGATVGFRARYIHGASYLNDPDVPPAAYIDSLDPVIDGMTTWDVRDGVLMNYNERLSLRNVRAIGNAEPFRHNYQATAAVGVGLDVGNEVTFGPGRIENVDLSGFEVGVIGPRHGAWAIDGLTIAATTDILLHNPEHTTRSLDLTNVVFAPLDGSAVDGRRDRANVVLAYNYNGDGDGVDPSTVEDGADSDDRALLADRVTLDGLGLYSVGQLADAAPISEGPLADLTNEQLVRRVGTSAGGALPPGDATTDPRVVNGLVGRPAPVPELDHTPGLGALDEEGEHDDEGGDEDDDEGGDQGTDGVDRTDFDVDRATVDDLARRLDLSDDEAAELVGEVGHELATEFEPDELLELADDCAAFVEEGDDDRPAGGDGGGDRSGDDEDDAWDHVVCTLLLAWRDIAVD
ncbi:MAG: G8 domain-containing protein [Actinomycetota bacterium]